ncbi:flagellar brake protein [Virgibacillus sp. MG-45]|uniref:flagellar brake protein n=1 Tax=Virgibacillus sp. MG-45 TaxID=3102791 RepID=UPI002EDAB525
MNFLNIGEFVTIHDISNDRRLRSKVVDKDDQYFYIDFPVCLASQKSVFFNVGDQLSFSYVSSDQTVYEFFSVVKKKVQLPIQALAMDYPDEDRIKTIQRRNFVRIETAIDVAVHPNDTMIFPFTTVSTDISGGGISIIIPTDTSIKEGEKVDLTLVLSWTSGLIDYVQVTAEVIRFIQLENKKQTASLKFIYISNDTRQQIIRYCFEKQREARKKELS